MCVCMLTLTVFGNAPRKAIILPTRNFFMNMLNFLKNKLKTNEFKESEKKNREFRTYLVNVTISKLGSHLERALCHQCTTSLVDFI